MEQRDQEWQVEEARVKRVVEKVREKNRSLEQETQSVQRDIVQIRRNFWEDVTVNLEDSSEAAETAASIRQQAEVLSERERRYRHAHKQSEVLRKLQKSPYFGRIDFQETGDPTLEKIYLGIGSFYDEEKEEFLVYDWRAPISSLYYDYPPGPASYETPSGKIEGELDRKRQFVIKHGELEAMFDTGVTIGDELLQEILGKQADANMKNIVATIQREQNQIIRDDRHKLIVVQGVAGSGKTSAALQRVAYLLYRYREHLRADQIVLFSPNPMFNSYISTVLPELGEENMQQTTFQDYLERELGKAYQLEDPFDQMEFVLGDPKRPGYDARKEGIQWKSSGVFFEALEKYYDLLGTQGLRFRGIRFRGEIVVSAKEIMEYFYQLDQTSKISHRLSLTQSWLQDKLREIEEQELPKAWVEDEIQNLDESIYDRVHKKLQKQKRYSDNTFDDLDREQAELAKIVVRRYIKPLRKLVDRLGFLDFRNTYRQLFSPDGKWIQQVTTEELPAHWKEICQQTKDKIDSGALFYEDATPFLYLKERLEGFRTNTTIRHVFLDEAQDYSPFQFAFIRRLFPRSKMTVLGDFNQSIYAHAVASRDPFAPIYGLFESNESIRFNLLKSYRSTKEIMEFARQMVSGGREIEPFERHGQKPVWYTISSEKERVIAIARQIERLQGVGRNSIAVLCKNSGEAKRIHQLLTNEGKVKAQLVHKHSASFDKGVVVIPSYLAKGIEFDAVLVSNASDYREEGERKLFYTACTRAMHELHLFAQGQANPFLRDVSPESYERR
ncbi:RNA polymerase recycling motor HelD [Risungbinella massiliensis]|uniref:RNA polymerase recycling motor HelD n=1 Tax=Risungbinella massiliensis TaxID=1329796 RepID=UPI0005CC6B80|nr:RNA polymerase recycling motor HelD [Risungbinella massiliensis]